MEKEDMFKLEGFDVGGKEEKLNTGLLNNTVELNRNSDTLKKGLKEHYNKLVQRENEIKNYVDGLKKEYDVLKINRLAIEKVISII